VAKPFSTLDFITIKKKQRPICDAVFLLGFGIYLSFGIWNLFPPIFLPQQAEAEDVGIGAVVVACLAQTSLLHETSSLHQRHSSLVVADYFGFEAVQVEVVEAVADEMLYHHRANALTLVFGMDKQTQRCFAVEPSNAFVGRLSHQLLFFFNIKNNFLRHAVGIGPCFGEVAGYFGKKRDTPDFVACAFGGRKRYLIRANDFHGIYFKRQN